MNNFSNTAVQKICMLTLLLCQTGYSQWETGAGYSVKNQYPFRGFSFFVEPRLPFQSADFGINLRAALEYYSDKEEYISNERISYAETHNTVIDINFLINFFSRNIQPYLGLGIGIGNYFVEKFESLNNNVISTDIKSPKFLTKLSVGLKFIFFQVFRPFIQLNLMQYWGSLEAVQFDRKISSTQVGGIFGLSFNF
jgi:hypothetical protein